MRCRDEAYAQVGTPLFCALEVMDGTYNYKADVFSFGLTIIEVLGKPRIFLQMTAARSQNYGALLGARVGSVLREWGMCVHLWR